MKKPRRKRRYQQRLSPLDAMTFMHANVLRLVNAGGRTGVTRTTLADHLNLTITAADYRCRALVGNRLVLRSGRDRAKKNLIRYTITPEGRRALRTFDNERYHSG